ncbi:MULTISPECIES: hypothetical protein [Streptomyces]|uniref:hypothetical protein n=1 Tax=Streptomyces TaxID=1883 RepID=UPI00163C0300|nr:MULTISPECIES: hypothetical protein [Streptomyces]MBC2873854.1 hypothetical protein [Streptomyces sp. TYQ1024]UBI39199.1 hypothetical protein K7I03_23905 [Streptomyces mobaraensis]UKW31781.1 hypothetical protein MCU78_23850 [Streptomyces sp. TYQ1024]
MRLSMKTAVIASTTLLGLGAAAPAIAAQECAAKSILGVNNTCKAVTKQTPGPFGF